MSVLDLLIYDSIVKKLLFYFKSLPFYKYNFVFVKERG